MNYGREIHSKAKLKEAQHAHTLTETQQRRKEKSSAWRREVYIKIYVDGGFFYRRKRKQATVKRLRLLCVFSPYYSTCCCPKHCKAVTLNTANL